MFESGYYKSNFSRLRLREIARLNRRGWLSFPRLYLSIRFRRPRPGTWFSNSLKDTLCSKEELSETFWEATASYRDRLRLLGFNICAYQKAKRNLNRSILDSGTIHYLDSTRHYEAGVSFVKSYTPTPVNVVQARVFVWFSAYFAGGSMHYSNQNDFYFDPPPGRTVVRVVSNDPGEVFRRFLESVKRSPELPQRFDTDSTFLDKFDSNRKEALEERIRRRIFIRMTDSEVMQAQHELRSPPIVNPLPPRFKFVKNALICAISIGAIFLWQGLYRRGTSWKTDDTIDYRGEHFKMRRAYESYEDYKDDEQNLDTNELDRIERTMTEAKVPTVFKDGHAFLQYGIYELQFPGYGMGGVMNAPQTDDASNLIVETFEIPQRDKSRCIAVRSTGGPYKVVDDFVYTSGTNEIRDVALISNVLRYVSFSGSIVREHTIE